MWKKLWKTTAVVSLLTFLSRILGFVRDMLAASLFGASGAYDAFLIAFKIPNLMRRLFAEGAFSQAFVPVLAQVHGEHAPESEKRFISHVGGCLLSILIVLVLLGMWGAPWIIHLFAPGFQADGRAGVATDLLRITFPYIAFISMAAFYSGILNIYNRFAVPAFTPVLLNVAMIGAMLFLGSRLDVPVQSLAIGAIIGGALQFFFLLPSLHRLDRLPIPIPDWRDPKVRQVLTLMGPAVLGASVIQINMLIDAIFASFLPTGSITWLYYAERMMEFPMGVFGIAITTVTLPYLAKQYAKKDHTAFHNALDWGFQSVLIVGLPASLGLYYLSGPILVSLFQYGAFSPADVLNTQLALSALSLALLAYLATKLFVSAYYAMHDTKYPVKVACVALLINVVGSLALIGPLKHQGLALASTFSAFTNASLLIVTLIRRQQYRLPPFFWPFLLKLVLATGVMLLALSLVTPSIDVWLAWSVFYRFGCLSGLIGLACVVYLAVLYGLGMGHLIRQAAQRMPNE
jgi:putative peptidoglycan lipid II flippase